MTMNKTDNLGKTTPNLLNHVGVCLPLQGNLRSRGTHSILKDMCVVTVIGLFPPGHAPGPHGGSGSATRPGGAALIITIIIIMIIIIIIIIIITYSIIITIT